VGKLLLLLPILLLLLRVRIEVKRLIGCSLTSFAWALSVWAVAADVVAVVESDHTKMFLQAISAVTAVAGVRQHLADVAVVAAVADQDGGEEEGGSCDRRQIILTIEFRRFDPDYHSTRIFLLCLHFFLFHFIIKPIQFYKCR